MVSYIPGKLHDKLQMPRAFRMINTFIITLCNDRYSNTDLMYDDRDTYIIELQKNDIIVVRWFVPPSDYDSKPYTYFVKVINEGEYKINAESIISKEFIEHNTKNGQLFADITKQYNRDIKIKQLLNQ